MTDPITTPAQMREAIAILTAMSDEYNRDDECEQIKINRLIERGEVLLRSLLVAEPERPAEGLLRGARDAVAITEVAKVISATITSFDLTWEHQSDQHRSMCMDAAVRVLGQIAQAEPEPQAVRVKPLVWEETHDDRGDGSSEHNGCYEASTTLGVYKLAISWGSDSYYWTMSNPSGNESGSYDDLIYAKAAAQTDYEARILAAIGAQPAEAIRDRALEDAAARVVEEFASLTLAEIKNMSDDNRLFHSHAVANSLLVHEIAASIRALIEKEQT